MRTSNKILTVAAAVTVIGTGINLAVNYGIYKKTKPEMEALLQRLIESDIRVVDMEGMVIKESGKGALYYANVDRNANGNVNVNLGSSLSPDNFHIEGDTLIVKGGYKGKFAGYSHILLPKVETVIEFGRARSLLPEQQPASEPAEQAQE